MSSTLSSGPTFSFVNEPFLDFTQASMAEGIRAGIAEVRTKLGKEYASSWQAAGGEKESIVSINPANPQEVIGVHSGGLGEVEPAMERAEKTFASWSKAPLAVRTGVLRKAAAKLREKKAFYSAWLVLEVGKNWAEADADVAEAIDFLEFYSNQAERLDASAPAIQFPGEINQLKYIPLGVGIVLPPWNFPLAILAGMTCASIVVGNTVVLKPSPLAPTIGRMFVELLAECGLPEGVVNLVQGGAKIGEALVAHPKARFIVFTGSKRAGLLIHSSAAQPRPQQKWIKRTILELGGKDSILVDSDADLDSAVQGIVASAYGFSGQKCSACSRLILHKDIYNEVLDAVAQKAKALQWGSPEENKYITPVIDRASYDKALGYLMAAPSQGRVVAGGEALTPPEQGFFIAPTVVTDVDPKSPIAQEEIFAPIVAVSKAEDIDEALEIANGTEYGLTGAIYSGSEEHLTRAAQEFHVGNLYLNRKCTGAMVGAHPFGGFNMSGTDSKAGGEDYLLLFTQAKSIARKK